MESVKTEVQKAKEVVKKVEVKASAAAKETTEKAAALAKETTEKASALAKETAKTAAKTKTVAKVASKKAKITQEKAQTVVKEAAKKVERISEIKVATKVSLQFGGRNYSTDELTGIAKDVWKYDLNQRPGDLKKIELYVKPEENKTYYVMNGEFTGSFFI